MAEFNLMREKGGNEKSDYLIREYLIEEGGYLPDQPREPDGYQIVLKGHEVWEDENGVLHKGEESIRTTYSNIDYEGAANEAAALMSRYRGEFETEEMEVRVFIPMF